MSLDKLTIIFLIIVVPIGFVLGLYTKTQTDTLDMQLEYDLKLNNATYDAVKAYQINSFNEDFSNLGNVRINNINAAVNTFYSSLSSSLNMAGYNQKFLEDYIPAIVFTMYDGYYIYSKYYNTVDKNDVFTQEKANAYNSNPGIPGVTELTEEDPKYKYPSTYQNGEQLYGLKPFIPYSCRYRPSVKDDNNDFVITYSLDNYIAIDGIIDGKSVHEAGYLLDLEKFDEGGGDGSTLENHYKNDHYIMYKRHKIEKEPLQAEYLLLENDDKPYPYKYTKVNGVKYYLDKKENWLERLKNDGTNDKEQVPTWFTVANGKKNTTIYDFGNDGYDYSALNFYYNAYNFSSFVQNTLNRTGSELKVKHALATEYGEGGDFNFKWGHDFLKNNNDLQIFDLNSNGVSIDEPGSNFNEHRLAVIRYCIEKNLSIAIANYNNYKGASGTTISVDFKMPEFREEEWDKIQDNMTMITYLQGLPIGTKLYNGVSVIPNVINDEVVTDKSIVIVPYDGNVSTKDTDYFYKIDQKGLVAKYKNDNKVGSSIKSPSGVLDYDLQAKYIDDGNGANRLYYYPKLYYNQYNVTHVNYTASKTGSDGSTYAFNGNLLKYIDEKLSKDTDAEKIVTAYYTAIAREREGQYKQQKNPQALFTAYDSIIPKGITPSGSGQEIRYRVKYDGNGGFTDSGAKDYDDTKEFIYGKKFELQPNEFVREGFNFLGWSQNAEDKSEKLIDGDSVNTLTSTNGETVVLYAIWQQVGICNINFDSKGGIGGPTEIMQVNTKNQLQDLDTEDYPLPTRTGYNFKGWFDKDYTKIDKSEENKQYYNEQGKSMWETIPEGVTQKTLYAKWEQRKYFVEYDKNDEQAEGTMQTSTFTYDVDEELAPNAYSKADAIFAGWSTSKENKVILYDKEKYRGKTAENGGKDFINFTIDDSFGTGDVYQLDVDISGYGTLYNYFEGENKGENNSFAVYPETEEGQGDGYNEVQLLNETKHYSMKFTIRGAAAKAKLRFGVPNIGTSSVSIENILLTKVEAKESQIFVNKQKVRNLTAEGSQIPLYAMWVNGRLDVTYEGNGGTVQQDEDNSLIAKYDAINNSEIEDHSNSTTHWADLDEKRTAAIVKNGTWGDNYLHFNGTNTWVNLGIINSEYQTIEVTFIPERNNATECIIGNWESGGGGIHLKAGKIVGQYTLENGKNLAISTSTVVESNKKYHVAITYNGLEMKMFVNGENIGNKTQAGKIKAPLKSTVMALGTNPTGSSPVNNRYFKGKILNFAIWKKALTPEQIAEDVGINVTYGSLYGEIPTPERKGYEFAGWYTALEGNENIEVAEKIGAGSKVKKTRNHQIYARWIPKCIYAKLYTDGTLVLSHSKNATYNGVIKKDYGDIESDNQQKQPPWKDEKGIIIKTIINDKIMPKTTKEWFKDCNKMQTIEGMEKLNTSIDTNMNSMFQNCSLLQNLDVSGLDTSNVIDMRNMFDGCAKLTALNLSNFNTINVTHMQNMFSNCSKLEQLDLTSFRTVYVRNMSGMFVGCENIQKLDLGSFSTVNVINMESMFAGCKKLKELNIQHFDTACVENMGVMFQNCESLTDLNLENFNTIMVEDMRFMFEGCANLENLDVSSFNTSKVTTMEKMFHGCKKLTELNFRNFDTSNVTDMNAMFVSCEELRTIYASDKFVVNRGCITDYMFSNCGNLVGGKGTGYKASKTNGTYARIDDPDNGKPGYFTSVLIIDRAVYAKFYDDGTLVLSRTENSEYTGNGANFVKGYGNLYLKEKGQQWSDVKSQIKKVLIYDLITPQYTNSWFDGCTNLEEIVNIKNLNTLYVTDMSKMFKDCKKLTSGQLDLSKFYTDNVTNMNMMFSGCNNVKELDLSNFKTNKVTTMDYMFDGCTKLERIWSQEGAFNTDLVEETDNNMFSNCSNKLVGGNGTKYNSNRVGKEYARLDKISGKGYFSNKGENIITFSGNGGTNLNNDGLLAKYDGLYNDGVTHNTAALAWQDISRTRDQGLVINGTWGSNYLQFNGTSTWVNIGPMNTDKQTIEVNFIPQGDLNNEFIIGNWENESGGGISIENGKITGIYYIEQAGETLPMKLTAEDVIIQKGEIYNVVLTYNGTKIELYVNGESVRSKVIEGKIKTPENSTVMSMGAKPTGGAAVESGTYFKGKILNAAIWSRGLSVDEILEDGGKTVKYNTKYGTLPTPSRLGYNFEGWYLEPTFKNRVTETTVSTKAVAHTLYAKWSFGIYVKYYEQDGTLFFSHNKDALYKSTQPKNEYDYGNICDPNLYELNSDFKPWYSISANIKKVEINDDILPQTTQSWFFGCTNLTEIIGMNNLKTVDVTDMSDMFGICSKLTQIDLSGFRTPKLTNISNMFDYCRELTTIDLSSLDTKNVTNMEQLFWNCEKLSNINFGNFNTSQVTNMYQMFTGCEQLTNLDLTCFDTSKVENMGYMFQLCSNLQTVNLSSFKTDNVNTMSLMFVDCENLQTLDLSNFNTENITSMDSMFKNCKNLQTIDLSSFNTENVTNMREMFNACEKLKTIYSNKNFITTKAQSNSNNMFSGCIALEGGRGTKYDATKTNYEYARIDGGKSQPGYFTKKKISASQIHIGDTVNYAPEYNSYKLQKQFSECFGYGLNTFSNNEGSDYYINKWKILNYDAEKGTVDIVPTKSVGNIKLEGAQGYNNAVFLLNDMCSTLYSTPNEEEPEYEITARSINMEDFLKAQDGNKLDTYMKSNSSNEFGYGFEKNAKVHEVPLIWFRSERLGNLNESEQNQIVNEFTSGYVDGHIIQGGKYSVNGTPMNFEFTDTYYGGNENNIKACLNSTKANLLFPQDDTKYWIATRCIDIESLANDDRYDCIVNFGIRSINMNNGTRSLMAENLFKVRGEKVDTMYNGFSENNNAELPIFPVVTVKVDLLEETGKQNEWDVDIEKKTIADIINVGDIINYSPEGQYVVDAENVTCDYTGQITVNTTGGDGSNHGGFDIAKWKVLNYDDKTVEIVPAYIPGCWTEIGSGTWTYRKDSTKTVNGGSRLFIDGIQGYNNGVKVLNDMCSALYGNEDYGIEARSINIEDFEKAGKRSKDNDDENTNDWTRAKPEEEQVTEPVFVNRNIPKIYQKEYNSVINGVTNTSSSALKKSEQDILYNGSITVTQGIQPYGTFYSPSSNINTTKALLDEEKSKVLFPEGVEPYKLASRAYSKNAKCFGMFEYKGGKIQMYSFLYDREENSYEGTGQVSREAQIYYGDNDLTLFPVVKLDLSLLDLVSMNNAGGKNEWKVDYSKQPSVGDTVNYAPTGSYELDISNITDDYTGKITLYTSASNVGGDNVAATNKFDIFRWKVLDYNEGKVQIVPEAIPGCRVSSNIIRYKNGDLVHTTVNDSGEGIFLQGIQGYNNGVKTLNDMCSSLYGNEEKGITARSISIEDFEKAGKKSQANDDEDNNDWTRKRDSYSNYDKQSNYVFLQNKEYPSIYADEYKSVINGVINTNEDALKISEQNNDYNGGKIATQGVKPYNTFYEVGTKYDDTVALLEPKKANVLLKPCENSAKYYLLASRYYAIQQPGQIGPGFGLFRIAGGRIGVNELYSSNGEKFGGPNATLIKVFPVVTIDLDLLEKTSDGWKVK